MVPCPVQEAFTHCSYQRMGVAQRCYQRLEFLGDALLDFFVTHHYLHHFP